MELRPLAYFNAACQQPSLLRAAAVLGLAPSTLSASLKGLEEGLGLPLFRRLGSGLYPAPAALWLYRTSLPALHAEAMARRYVAAPDLPLLRLTLEIRLSFSIGRVAKAVSAAIESLGATMPHLMVTPDWRNPSDAAPTGGPAPHLVIAYDDGQGGEPIVEDRFVLARAMPEGPGSPPRAVDLLRGPVVVPLLPAPLLALARRFLQEQAAEVNFSEEEAGALPRLAAERPDAAFLIPHSLLADRLGLPGFRAVPLPDAPGIAILARGAAEHPGAAALAAALRACLSGEEQDTIFRPTLTLRQFQTFEALLRVRRVTAAARSLGITQPAVTEQLRRTERALGTSLFTRRRDGLVPTKAAGRLDAVSGPLLHLPGAVPGNHVAAPGERGGRLALGLPPSAGPGDELHARLAPAIAAWLAGHPALRLRILDGPTAILQAWIREGALDLALVEAAPSAMPRFSLDAAEPLVMVGAPGHLPEVPLTLDVLLGLPLVLAGTADAARRLLDAAGREAGIAFRPAIEVASLPITLALVRAGGFFTLAAPSAVAAEVAAGRLACRTIEGVALQRPLFIIYDGERPLTPAERALVAALREALRGLSADAGRGDAGRSGPAAAAAPRPTLPHSPHRHSA